MGILGLEYISIPISHISSATCPYCPLYWSADTEGFLEQVTFELNEVSGPVSDYS